MKESGTSRVAIISVITLVVGLIVGGLIGAAAGNMNDNDKMSSDNNSSQMAMDSSDGVTVGGAKMVKTKDIVDNAVNASNVSTTVSLVKLAGLVDTLKSDGPFTVFAPNNDAFNKLPDETVASLQKPENVETLKKILTYHVVSGTFTAADLKVMAQNNQTLTTVQGELLTPILEDNTVKLRDAMGSTITIQTSDVISSNGVTHVIESVLMPRA